MAQMPFAAQLREAAGRRTRVLAWARAEDGVVAGLLDALAVHQADAWTLTPWDEIEHARFDNATAALWWTAGGTDRCVRLTEPGRLPEFVRERVQASILAEQPVSWDGGRATIVVRRNPGRPDAALRWAVVARPGTVLNTPRADQAIAAALTLARQEWDIG